MPYSSLSSAAPHAGRVSYPILRELLLWLTAFLSRHRRWFLRCVLLGLIAATLLSSYQNISRRTITLLSGPAGSDDDVEAVAILEQALASQHGNWLLSRRLATEQTQGYAHNYQLVADDTAGSRVGFALDGLGTDASETTVSGDVQTLLPLEWQYLHVIVTDNFVDKCRTVAGWRAAWDRQVGERDRTAPAGRAGAAPPTRLEMSWLVGAIDSAKKLQSRLNDDQQKELVNLVLKGEEGLTEADRMVLSTVASPQFYLGPPQSGSRAVADRVCRHCRLRSQDIEATGIGDFKQMRIALNKGEIDGGFHIAPIDSSVMLGVAYDAKCQLVSLDFAEGIGHRYEYLKPVTLPKMSYHNGDTTFCPNKFATVATRRVLVGPPSLGKRDAFFMADQTARALHRPVKWQAGPPGSNKQGNELFFPRHPGHRREDGSPPYDYLSPQNLLVLGFLLPVLIGLVGDAANSGVQVLRGDVQRRIDRLSSEVDAARRRAMKPPHKKPNRDQIEAWENAANKLEEDLIEITEHGRLTWDQMNTLTQVLDERIRPMLRDFEEDNALPESAYAARLSEIAQLGHRINEAIIEADVASNSKRGLTQKARKGFVDEAKKLYDELRSDSNRALITQEERRKLIEEWQAKVWVSCRPEPSGRTRSQTAGA